MMERFLRAFRRSRDLVDVLALTADDLRDLGVTRDQMMLLNTLPDDVPSRVLEMGRVWGLTDADMLADSDRWHLLLLDCHKCRDLPACRRFMVREDKDAPVETGFCPNTEVFEEMAMRGIAAE